MAADWTLKIEIITEAKKALAAMKEAQKAVKSMERETSLTSRKTQIDTKKMATAFAAVGVAAALAFKKMIDASPSLTIAMLEINYAVKEIWRSIGEELAPILEDTLIPAIESLRDWFVDLNPELQAWIGLTIALIPLVVSLAGAVFLLDTALLPIIAGVVLISALIAGVIILWRDWNNIIDNAAGAWKNATGWVKALGIALAIIFLPITLIVGAIVGVIAIIKNWGNIIDWFKGVWEGFVGFLGNAGEFFKGVGEAIAGAFKSVMNFFIKAWNDYVVSPVNTLVEKLNETFPNTFDIGWRLSEIPTLHTGGIFVAPPGRREGLANLSHREEVLKTSDPRHRDNVGRGGGGGGVTISNTYQIGSMRNKSDIDYMINEIERRQTRIYRARGLS